MNWVRNASSLATAALFTVTVAGAVAAGGCRQKAALPGPDVVAKVGDRELRAKAFDAYLQRNLGEPGGGLASEVLSRLFDQFVREELLATLARERGLIARGVPAAAAVEPLLAATPVPEPGETDVAAYFAAHAAEFTRPARVHLRQILVDDRLVAERARRELAAGVAFETVLAKVTPQGSSPAGGDQGLLAHDELPPAFADLIFRLDAGKLSDVVPADYGFHIFQVVERLPAENPTLAEVEPTIRRQLREATADAHLKALFADAQSRYTVAVYDRNLPFNYRGSFPTSRPHEER
ncbi:MAG: peptidyl-prolyl cis-trans isomerase [Thermoanaerobaculia bacterium]